MREEEAKIERKNQRWGGLDTRNSVGFRNYGVPPPAINIQGISTVVTQKSVIWDLGMCGVCGILKTMSRIYEVCKIFDPGPGGMVAFFGGKWIFPSLQ